MLLTTQPSVFQSSSHKSAPRQQSRLRASSLRHETKYHDDDHNDTVKSYQRSATRKAGHARHSSSPTRTSSRLRDTKQQYEMPLASTSVASISALAATARNLFRRAKISGADFADVAAVVRSLHTVIKHLRAEAEDPDSLLNSTQQESSVYARQLTPIVEDTDFTLKQLDTILEKYGSYPSDFNNDDGEIVRRGSGRQIEDRERDMLQLIRTKLANQKTHIDIFLDTVQLHNPSTQHRPVDLGNTDDKQQNNIKDKVDIVAQRLFQRRARDRVSGDATEESEEEMWQLFQAELVKEGFSSDVLRKHKEVLRAYIRELEENGSVDDNPPSVRGLLDHESGGAYAPPAYGSRQQYGSPLPPPVAIPASYLLRGDTSPKELLSPAMDNEKFSPAVKLARRRPDQSPIDTASANARDRSQDYYNPSAVPAEVSYERRSSDSASDTESNDQLALISTRDLMDSDHRQADMLAVRIGGLQLSPGLLPGTSPNGRHLSPPSAHQGHKTSDIDLSSSPAQACATSPRYVPVPSIYSGSPASSTPPPAYSTAPIPIPASAPPTTTSFPPPPMGPTTSPRRSRLAPDSQGAEIPIEAKWTRIKRSLVSPEVLDKAGMRYEARPDFVAVLGVLSREDIADLARKTVEVRATRGRGYSDTTTTSSNRNNNTRYQNYYNSPDEKRNPTKKYSRHSSDSTDDDEEASLTSSEPIWDDSDSSGSDSDSQHSRSTNTTRERSGSATDKYIPRDARRATHRRSQHRRDSATIIQEETEPEEDADDDRRGKNSPSRHRRRSRIYPVIVDAPADDAKGSPAATVAPKPILKNRNENHVRFDADGPREMSLDDLERERERRERRERRRRAEGDDRRRRSERSERGGDRERERERGDRGDRDRDRSDRHRDRDQHTSSSHRHRESRDESTRDRRRTRKSVWKETVGAVGIGGAAASLLSVLTEAAAGF